MESRRGSTTWPQDPVDLVAEQERLARAAPPPWRPEGIPLVAACYVCFDPEATRGWAGAALSRGHRHLVAAVLDGGVRCRYRPGLLALREGPLLDAAVRALPARPDVLLVNATGRDHPRRAGLALHLGAVLDLPSVGVTDRPLLAAGVPPGAERWASSPLLIERDVVGAWLRTRRDAKPVAISPGWRTDVETALAIASVATRRARTPEPLRRARRAAREVRARKLCCA